MNSYDGATGNRLYRDADRAILGGVCAGLAGHFGLNLKVTRFLAVVAFFMAMPFAVFGYLAAVFLIPAQSRNNDHVSEIRCCWRTRRRKHASKKREEPGPESYDAPERPPAPTIKDVRQRYSSLDKRLAELEKQVTSPRFQLEQEFRKLR